MLPDPGCYEERYRRGRSDPRVMPAWAVFGLGVGLLTVGLLLHHQLIFAALTVGLLTIPTVLTLALPRVAFRADRAGITLGSDWQLPRPRAVFIPWADVEKIILYSSDYTIQYVGVQRREGAPPLPKGNEEVRVPRYPVSGLAAGATLRIKGWRLDREQLAAVTAAVAPGILVIDARKDPGRRIEGPGQRQDRQLWVV
jgi:hypothetical protein